jgi:hypothetical protein
MNRSLTVYFRPKTTGQIALSFALLLVLVLGGLVEHAEGDRKASLCPRSAAPEATNCESPLLRFRLDATISPRRLPSQEFTPSTLEIKGGMPSGASQVPALREIVFDFDKDMAIASTDLHSCPSYSLRSSNSKEARRLCKDSIVGYGNAHAVISAETQSDPVPLTLTLFNRGMSNGRWRLYIHFFGKRPLLSSRSLKPQSEEGAAAYKCLLIFPESPMGLDHSLILIFQSAAPTRIAMNREAISWQNAQTGYSTSFSQKFFSGTKLSFRARHLALPLAAGSELPVDLSSLARCVEFAKLGNMFWQCGSRRG